MFHVSKKRMFFLSITTMIFIMGCKVYKLFISFFPHKKTSLESNLIKNMLLSEKRKIDY